MADVVVLDHHQTAQKALEGLNFAHFDMTKSGAVLAWNTSSRASRCLKCC